MTEAELFATVCHPIRPRAPRRSMSLRMALILAGIATAIGALIGLMQIYEVMHG